MMTFLVNCFSPYNNDSGFDLIKFNKFSYLKTVETADQRKNIVLSK